MGMEEADTDGSCRSCLLSCRQAGRAPTLALLIKRCIGFGTIGLRQGIGLGIIHTGIATNPGVDHVVGRASHLQAPMQRGECPTTTWSTKPRFPRGASATTMRRTWKQPPCGSKACLKCTMQPPASSNTSS